MKVILFYILPNPACIIFLTANTGFVNQVFRIKKIDQAVGCTGYYCGNQLIMSNLFSGSPTWRYQ